ncbi:hypothetical protein GGR54DRAFT_176218 [Hypoxylon sp. NC1633]|nr:hypothetical protein GGR54DRAFT_176218 [Hypoxylon sp. NC1633]
MRHIQTFLFLALTLLLQHAASLQLNVTAIGARDGASTIECWQLEQPFDISTDPGTSGSAVAMLSSAANMSYTVLPSNYDGGLHNGPHKQWVVFTTGLAYITLPDDNSTSAYVTGGQFGLLFVADTADVSQKGHRTQYPGITETVALQIPTCDGRIPEHTVLHMGPCNVDEISGLRGLAAGGKGSDST